MALHQGALRHKQAGAAGNIMMQFHMPTLLVMLLVASATLTFAVGWVACQRTRDGASMWTLGLALNTLAIVLLGLRGVIPDVLSIVIGNVTLSCTYALYLGALCQLQQRRLAAPWFWLPPVLLAGSLSLLMSDVHGRVVVSGLIFAAQHLLILCFVLSPRQALHGRGKHLLVVACIIMIGIIGYRSAAFYHAVGVIPDLSQASSLQALLFIASFVALLLASNGFVLMAKEQADQRFRRQSQKDTLTGVWTRAYLEEAARQEISRQQRYGHAVSLVMIDIDHFKQINDRFGHAMGDRVLVEFCQVAQKCIRATDILGRWGGEEFLLILPNTDSAHATELAERIRNALERHAFPAAQRITASFGLSLLLDGEDWEAWLQRADMMLYRAKAAGRNRVEPAHHMRTVLRQPEVEIMS
jgi:diguanylate cyclase (GGDEF)-like protein